MSARPARSEATVESRLLSRSHSSAINEFTAGVPRETYAITDRIQATVTTWPVIVKDQPFFVDGSFKAKFCRSDIVRFAVAGGVMYVASTVSRVNDTACVGQMIRHLTAR